MDARKMSNFATLLQHKVAMLPLPPCFPNSHGTPTTSDEQTDAAEPLRAARVLASLLTAR
jgi:hypothetical protein